MGTRRTKTDLVIPAGSDMSGLEDLITGGPGVGDPPAPAPAAAPAAGVKMREVTINGVKYTVPAETADALEASSAAQAAELARMRGELETATRRPAPAAAPPVEADDFDTQLFLNPTEALAKREAALMAKMREEYSLDQQRAKWWSDFYGAHKHLVGSNLIVEAVMNKHFKELEALPVDKQADALADKVEAELERVFKSRPRKDTPAPSARPVESGAPTRSGPGAPPAAESDYPSDRVVSISELQRNMRKRRLEARTGRAQG